MQITILGFLIFIQLVFSLSLLYGGSRDRSDSKHRLLYLMTLVSVLVWLGILLSMSAIGSLEPEILYANVSIPVANTLSKAAFMSVGVTSMLMWTFLRQYEKTILKIRSFSLSYYIAYMVSILLFLLPLSDIFSGSYYPIEGSLETFAFAYGSLSIVLVGLLALVLSQLFIGALSNKKKSPELSGIYLGFLLMYLHGLIFMLVIPLLADTNAPLFIGSLCPLYAIIIGGYSLFKYKIFDLRTSVFRAVGYSLSIFTLVAIYSVLIYGAILPIISPETTFELTTLVLIVFGTAATIYFYGKVKIIFDAITDRLFFKNSYVLAKFLDEFNQALINSTDIGDLADSIMKVLGSNLKTEFFILIVKQDRFEITIDSRRKESMREVDSQIPVSMVNYHFKSGDRVVLRDYLDKNNFEGLNSKLTNMEISAAIDLSEASRATTSLKKALESGNFKTMLLGPKKSGENYNAQDLDALRIIAKELVIALQNAMRFEEIKLFNLELQHKIDLATIKLRQQNKKLVVADEQKDDFLSLASHQMRTPISTILGYASILSSGDAGKLTKDQQKFAKIMEASTKRLSYLINDFLTVSRLKSGKFTVDLVECDIKKVIVDEVESLKEQFKSKDIRLKVNVDNHIGKMKIDEQKIRQVMMNLIDNALHYTNAGGEVEATLKREGNSVVFEVKDSGIGVPKEDQAHLFSKMFRSGNARDLRPDGTGLGLYLAKKVVLGHHGHIVFKSEVGKGSTFGFKIPIK